MPTKSSLLARALIIFIALFALLIAYYWVHKPFDAAVFARVGGALLDLLTVAALIVMVGGIGRAALRRFDLSIVSHAERVALEGGIGAGIVALAALIAGLVGLFRPPLLWALLIVIGILLRRSLVAWLVDLRDLLRAALRVESAWDGMISLYCVLMLALALVNALAPPAHWDSLTYHLVAPQRYLHAGAISAQPDNFYLGFVAERRDALRADDGLVRSPHHRRAGAFRPRRAGAAGDGGRHEAICRACRRAAGGAAAAERLQPVGAVRLGIRRSRRAAVRRAGAGRRDGVARDQNARLARADRGDHRAGDGRQVHDRRLGAALALFVLIHEPRRAVQNGVIIGLAALAAFAPWG
ncbi:MAG: hypothetical protein U0703_18030 [Anaerolineae bacterium]